MSSNQFELIPILSNEIEISNLSKSDFVLSNKKHKHYLKISKEVKDLLSIIDNKKNIIEITETYNANFNTAINPEFVYNLVYVKLSQYGLLENYGEIKNNGKPSYLKLSTIILNEKIVSGIVKYFYFLFNPKIALSLVCFAMLFFVYALVSAFDFYTDFNIQKSLLSLFFLSLISAIIHEIGHATSTSLFGSKHGGIGAGFYLFSPVLFADVTDIWRLSKKKRIIVNLSGIYFEVLFCTVLLLLNFVVKSKLLEMLAIIIFIKTFFNLNPLVRSDGYWILADLTSQPNLFKNAYQKINTLILFIFGKRKLTWNKMDILIFFYGILSILFITYFLIYSVITNPSSILYFPKNLLLFIQSIFKTNSNISIQQVTELFVPFLFYYFVFRLLKNSLMVIYKKKTPINKSSYAIQHR